jgi:DNA-binding CsgD family transcriptional regulator
MGAQRRQRVVDGPGGPDGRALLRALDVLEPMASADTAEGLSAALFEMLPRLLDLRSVVIFHDIVAASRPSAAFSLNTVERSLETWQEMYEINPIYPFVQQRTRAAVITLKEVAGRVGDIRTSPFYRRYMTVDGFDKQAVVPIRHNGRVRSAVSIRRDNRQDPFGPAELELVRRLQPFLAACFARVWREEEASALAGGVERRAEPLHPGVGFFDTDGGAISAGPGFRAALDRWRGRDEAAGALPAVILEAVEELGRGWAARRFGDDEAPYLNVRRGGEVARVTLVRPLPHIPPIVEVALAAPPSATLAGQPANAALLRLTPGERDVVGLVLKGMTNAQIAYALGKVEGTVKGQLHAIYRKLEVPNRAGLMLLLS